MRGSRGYSSSYSPRGSSYRGSSRGSPWNSGGGRGGGYGKPRESYSSSFETPRFSGGDRSYKEDYPKSYRKMESYGRERHSPDRKRPRNEGPPRHEYGRGYDSYPSERREYSERERHPSSSSYRVSSGGRREEFRKPPPIVRGGGRGRISSRGIGSSRGGFSVRRERGGGSLVRRRLADRSYIIKKRGLIRSGEFSRRSRGSRIRSSIGRRRIQELLSDSEKESSEEEVKKIKTEKADESETAEGEDAPAAEEGEKKADDEAEAEKKEKKEKKESTAKSPGRVFIKLACPQCNIKAPTFRSYEIHLRGRTHLINMRKLASKQRLIINQMRQSQRSAQNELEKSGDGITVHTVYCPVCKLNYKQERAVHQATSAHVNMKAFLMPKCKVCKISFKSPMVYEHHLCSIEHLKVKQKSDAPVAEVEEDLNEFTTIDSVGDEKAAEEAEKEAKKKTKVNIGAEKIMKIEAHYCDMCRMFLPIGTENEYPDILASHCRKHFHVSRYMRYKESEEIKAKAEKLRLKELAEKEAKKEDDGEKASDEPAGDVEMADADVSKSAEDDKLWDAVDKDLGELLEEETRDDEDDEEGVNGERYDRFKSADAGKDADPLKAEKKGQEVPEAKK
ncbi:unnamed protein product [Ceutorhynchus assimilis]|uniref:C2H2-type domain-containing protein n=1 Tax=Ceutorhynchus assimilis TaxID=467358 RepID=A0A9N9MUX0_9CUCU|nr:unnamed protein product [Ceutorhynchus assimilis]